MINSINRFADAIEFNFECFENHRGFGSICDLYIARVKIVKFRIDRSINKKKKKG